MRKRFFQQLSGLFFILFVLDAQAVGVYIPASARVDMTHDSARNVIYISNGSQILRYDLGSASFLTPYGLGGSLSGIDLSPDGNTLAVADRAYDATNLWIHLINLNTGVSSKITFPREFYEGGAFTVSYGNDGKLLVSSMFQGSGWVPLRKYDPTTGDVEILKSMVRQDTMLNASGDAGTIAYTESNISSGPIGRYNVDDQVLEQGPSTGWFTFEVGTNKDGTHYSVPTYDGTFVYDGLWSLQAVIGTYAGPQPIGVVYHPVEDRVYYPWAETTEVREFDTTTNTQIAAYDFEDTFAHTGNFAFRQGRMKISRDGSLLMATVTGGVRILRLYEPLNASSQSITLDEDVSTPVTLSGTIGNGGTLSYSISAAPSIGALSGTPPSLIYTPNENASGKDSFTYKVQYGRAEVEASVAITVNPVNDAPLAFDDFVNSNQKRVSIPVLLNDSDVDGDSLTIISVAQPISGGMTSISDDGQTVEYERNGGKDKSDSFEYTISDGNGGTSTATVYVNR
jgi:hypothetical protein